MNDEPCGLPLALVFAKCGLQAEKRLTQRGKYRAPAASMADREGIDRRMRKGMANNVVCISRKEKSNNTELS